MGYSSELRRVLSRSRDRGGPLVCPAVHDPLTARVVDLLDFEAVYLTGYGSSLSVTGYPDAGLVTMPEMVEHARNVQETVSLPLVADADTGYGNATNVVRTVREYVRAGVGGVHIEDQVVPKRCGTVSGKAYVDRAEAVGKIRAAVDVRDERDEDFVVIGRSDVEDTGEAIERVNAYADAGADLVYPSGVDTVEGLERTGERVDAPLMYTNSAVADKPVLDHERLSELGFDVVVYWDVSMLATVVGTYAAFGRIADGDPSVLDELSDDFDGLPVEDLHEFAGFPEVLDWEERYVGDGSADFSNT